MSNETWLESKLRGVGGRVSYETERLIIGINEQIVERMETQNVSRAQLADRLGVNKAQITRMLNGTPNMTLKTLVSVATALGCRVSVPMFHELRQSSQAQAFNESERSAPGEEFLDPIFVSTGTEKSLAVERPPMMKLDLVLHAMFRPVAASKEIEFASQEESLAA